GEMYRRQEVQVELDDGRLLPAATYVARPEFLAQLELYDWDFAGFLRRGKKLFQEEYREPLSE
ncbi:MAG: gamma-glutamylcyclotransferase, partial [Desulfuromonadales bacterium]|nr:gamma-glutamylcyclotransferase [Desulfuromonadales bacterium]